ncbi:toxin TcdB middle/N-terminal domain-containing protein [Bradyrhizobium sp. Arg314]
MKRLLIGAAVLAAGIVGADISVVDYIRGSASAVASAQETQGSSGNTAAPANGLGNGGAGFGSGAHAASGTTDQPQAGGSGTAQTSPDAASKVGSKPDNPKTGDAKAADTKATGKAAKTTDTESAPEEPAAAAATAAATTTSGDPEAIGTPKVDLPKAAGNGNLGYSIAIDAPAFHGIEPQVALNYNSSRKTKLGGLYQGWLGYAWGLDGFDVIERATPGYGMPAYDANDIYLLDGQAMVACVAGMVSPSCSTGGTHATENESYRRIALNGATNEWKVTDRDGTVSTFRSVGAVANLNPAAGTPAYDLAQNYRWLLTSVTDTNGNTVTYNYSCPASPTCYASSVTYNGASIQFYYETRPDLILMGNGRDISQTSQRIKTIGVLVGASMRSAYKLTYDQAPFSNTSRLTQVTRYGTDAAIAGDGTITGGTSKVIAQMTYQNTDGVYSTINTQLQEQALPPNPNITYGYPNKVGDLDFNGRDEVYGTYSVTTKIFLDHGERSKSTEYYASVLKFNQNGVILSKNNIPGGLVGSLLGRFNPDKNTMDFARYGTSESCHPTHNGDDVCTYSASSGLVLTDTQLALTSVSCRPTPPVGYQSVCSVFPYGRSSTPFNNVPTFVADPDGDGIDNLNVNNWDIAGIGDFLGNGRQRPLLVIRTSVNKGVLSNGTWKAGATSFAINCQEPGSGYLYLGTCVLADLNGDGATDILRYNNADDSVAIWLSTGVGFKSYSVVPIRGTSAVLRDFDNDGKTDVITIGGTAASGPWRAGTVRVFSLRPSSTSMTPVQFTLPSSIAAGTMVGDFNGDGLPEFTDYSHMFISNAGTGNPNLVKQIVTELGGTVAVEYTPSSTWTNNYLPQLVHAVTKLSVSDGLGQTAVSSYRYSGGKYDPAARKFLGFASIVETRPLANGETAASKIETTYRQDLASYGLPSLTVWKDGAGTVHKQVAETYAVNAASKPYTVQNTATDTTLTENLSRTLRVERGFDAYNNITSLKDYGRTDVSGDETWGQKWFAPNTSAYIVSLPRIETMQAGLDNSFPFIRYKASFYDNLHTDNNTPPTKGNLTWTADYNDLYGTPQKATHQFFAYDAYGNRISASNGLGHRTEWNYDATYHLYPVTERAPRFFATGGQTADTRFVSSATFNPVCGLPATRTDPNGLVKTFTYDPFCRPYQVSQSVTGAYAKTRFENEGNPAAQALVKYTPLPNGASGGAGEDFTRSYYDGLGRVYRVETPGETAASARRIADTDYDQRSNVLRTAFPRFVGDTAQWTTNAYDWADRLVATVNPDASQRAYLNELAIATGSPNPRLNAVTLTDELGHQTKTTSTTRGDIAAIARDFSGLTLLESSSYDALGRLIGVTDPGGSTWAYSYDMLGNRLSASDPDLGTWTYVYDAANRLTSQTDARGTTTNLSYDQMDRPTLKTATPSGGSAVTLTQNTYDQAAAGYYNIGQLTTSTNPAATQSLKYDGFGKVARQDATIGTLTHTTITTRDASGQAIATQYLPVQLDFGTVAAPLQYTAGNKLASAPGFITSTLYEADGQTKEINYANGVKTAFTYSPTRRWVTRVTTSRGATVLLDDQYARDTHGRITGTTGLTASDSWTYGYDNADRLTSSDHLGDNTYWTMPDRMRTIGQMMR